MPDDPWHPKLDQYLDSELSGDEMRAMDAHLRECPACASDALERLRLKRAVRMAGQRYAPSAEFRQRVERQIAAKRPRRGWLWIPALAAVAALLVAAILLGRWHEHSRSEQLLTELADLHVADLASPTPVDVVSADRHTVKPWFQGKLPFTFDLPDLEGTGYSLAGGRITYLQHEPGAHLLYNVGAHHISVFIFRDRPEIDLLPAADSTRRVLSFEVESWAAGGLRYFAFSDASPAAIEGLCRLLQKAGT